MSDSSEQHPPSAASQDGYVVVARRYRPKSFDELVGQDHVGRALVNAIETGRVGHAYLFTGARGVGKTSTARIFAKALNDPGGPTGTPDQETDVAQAIDAGEDVDVIEIDGASNRGIDEIRSLRANVGVRPSRSRYKIYIIDEVHMLTQAAFNALLKTLEEPPEHVKFIFCTTDPEKIPITVLSRCQRFDFAPVEVSKIVARLKEICSAEGTEADDTALELIARRAAGSMRDSQSLLEQLLSFSGDQLTAETVHQMLGTADDERLHALATAMAARDAASALSQLDAAVDEGVDAGRLAEQLLGYFRDLMAVTVGCEASMLRHTSAGLYDELTELGKRWGLQTVLAVVGLIDDTLVRIRHSVYARVLLESTLIQICHLPDLQSIADLAEAAKTLPEGARLSTTRSIEPEASGSSAAESKKKAPAVSLDSTETDTVPTPSPAANAARIDDAHVASSPVSGSDGESLGRSGSNAAVAAASAVATASPPVPAGSLSGKELWARALQDMDPMTSTLATSVEDVSIDDSGQVVMTFPAKAGLAMGRCDKPVHRQEIIESLRRLTGRDHQVIIKASTKAVAEDKPVAKAPQKSRVQWMREVEANSLVQSCKEVFSAEVTKIDLPRNDAPRR
ncbi:DNA polymerase III subunit gamma/tau [Crateriforma conspicua]|uniref:DNA polymerase III subunit gamma/tau n=1 Tax=Crateriforma conspicua TaxID=2527996 RepID=A0A5C6FW44_9PLAN|nr:DNA polymerase III subunit gamma/tau [Crateriforma conspicua]TWU66576.1 DNA polymerase III subunit tau [Crateriforma conspicua]